jgi:hypothetical protein
MPPRWIQILEKKKQATGALFASMIVVSPSLIFIADDSYCNDRKKGLSQNQSFFKGGVSMLQTHIARYLHCNTLLGAMTRLE